MDFYQYFKERQLHEARLHNYENPYDKESRGIQDIRDFYRKEGDIDRQAARDSEFEGMSKKNPTDIPIGSPVVIIAKNSIMRGEFGTLVGITPLGWCEVQTENGRKFTFKPDEIAMQEDD